MTRPNGAHSNERRLFLFVYYYHFFLLFVVGLVTCPWSSTDVIYQISQQFRIVDNAILRALLDVFIRMFFFFIFSILPPVDRRRRRRRCGFFFLFFWSSKFILLEISGGEEYIFLPSSMRRPKGRCNAYFLFLFSFSFFFLRRAANFIFHAGALVAWLFYFFFFS